ncbi:GNAT family N-acetyltransferase [Heyndrickxia acidicola]|uniref:GNAT family N-acetyltransferase n=1 Tax=Heyndrickxia acidicola TaxID=209389 RepID=A0ABU6MBU4_9BACI|nr:GNAT family N-acetyltransferase [Heyndrickxia acidicola]MED1201862.1 GNAT family N-acetyltransferase [Heyndrickxia acidicola]
MLNHQLDEIRRLQLECEQYDGIQLKLNWEMLKTRNSKETNDFFHYEKGELTGYLALYGFGSKIEICGMVKPDNRRKGIFSNLFQEALKEITDRRCKEVLLNAPAASPSAKGFLQTTASSFSITEYQMKWNGTEPMELDHSVSLIPADPSDKDLEIELDVQGFGLAREDAEDHYQRVTRDEANQFYIILSNTHKVGKMRVSHDDGEAWIYGFAILPEFQAKGIGRNALKWIIKQEHSKGYPIFLEVEAQNSNALKLYESCGFRSFHAQDYYQLDIQAALSHEKRMRLAHRRTDSVVFD